MYSKNYNSYPTVTCTLNQAYEIKFCVASYSDICSANCTSVFTKAAVKTSATGLTLPQLPRNHCIFYFVWIGFRVIIHLENKYNHQIFLKNHNSRCKRKREDRREGGRRRKEGGRREKGTEEEKAQVQARLSTCVHLTHTPVLDPTELVSFNACICSLLLLTEIAPSALKC